MRTVWNFIYGIERSGRQSFEIPKFSTFLYLRETPKVPGEYDPSGLMNASLWYEVDTNEERRETVEFEAFKTGNDIPVELDGKKPFYRGTFLPGSRFELHLFEWVSFTPPYESLDL